MHFTQVDDRLHVYVISSIALTVFIGYIGYNETDMLGSYMRSSRPIFVGRYNDVVKYLDRIEVFFLILDMILCLGAISYVVKIPKEKSFEMEIRTKFELEKEWLWTRLSIFVFTSVTTIVELVSWRANNEYEVFVIADAIKFLCAFGVFTIIATKSDIQSLLTKKYNSIINKSERLEFVNNSV